MIDGKFITIEGIEGAGKSSVARSLKQYFDEQAEQEVVLTREPGGSELGTEIRKILLSSKKPSREAELLLFLADRAEHVRKCIRPALEAGKVVICDRYVHSTLAYQGYARGLEVDKLWELCQFATGGLMPDIVLLLDLPPKLGLERARKRTLLEGERVNQSWNRFEQEELEFHAALREGFLSMQRLSPEVIYLLDAKCKEEELVLSALEVIKNSL